jgi:hypothetical protein
VARAPDRTCPEILVNNPRKGEVCGRAAASDGWCDNHGPSGRNAQLRAKTRQRHAETECQHLITRGKRKGELCGLPPVAGKSVCVRHDPDAIARRPEHRKNQCKATSATTGEQCTEGALPGLDVCSHHGGRAPRAKAKSAEFVRQEKARTALERLGVDVTVVTNPYLALQHHAAQMIAWRDYCAGMAMALDPSQVRYSSQQELEQVRGEIQIYQRSQQDTTTALAALARLQVDEHLAAIHAATLAMLLSALRDTLAAAGLDTAAASAIKSGFAQRVRVIEGTVADDGSEAA